MFLNKLQKALSKQVGTNIFYTFNDKKIKINKIICVAKRKKKLKIIHKLINHTCFCMSATHFHGNMVFVFDGNHATFFAFELFFLSIYLYTYLFIQILSKNFY